MSRASSRADRAVAALAAAAATAACTSEAPVLDWIEPAGVELRIEPAVAEAQLLLTGGAGSAPRRFVALLRTGSASSPDWRDVTGAASWTSDRPEVARPEAPGAFALGPRAGGHVLVTARHGQVTATARLVVKVVGAFLDPRTSPPAEAPQRFGGRVDPARAPQIVYPLEDVMLPPDLGGLEVQFRRGPATNTLFEIALSNDVTDVRVYTRCQVLRDGCVARVEGTAWTALAETNRGRASLALAVRATDDQGLATGHSARQALHLARDDLAGTLYYWSNKKVFRAPRSLREPARPEVVYAEDPAANRCLGCHSVSRDGAKLVVSMGQQASAVLVDLRRGTTLSDSRATAIETSFLSWNPDGSAFVTVPGMDDHRGPKNLVIGDGTTAAKVAEIPLGGLRANAPDWSWDGTRIAFASVDTTLTFRERWPRLGGISYVEWERDRWSSPRAVVPRDSSKNRYAPAIAPTGDFVVYAESICPPGRPMDDACDGSQDPAARLWAARLASGAAPVELGALARPGPTDVGLPLASYGPHWNGRRYRATVDREIVWLTFASTRRFGLRSTPPSPEAGKPGARIWMAAVEPARLAAGQDASFAPFCVPFQDLATSNQMPQWTTE